LDQPTSGQKQKAHSASCEHRGQTRTGSVCYVSNSTVVPPPLLQLLPPLRSDMQPACTPVCLAEVCLYRSFQYRPLPPPPPSRRRPIRARERDEIKTRRCTLHKYKHTSAYIARE